MEIRVNGQYDEDQDEEYDGTQDEDQDEDLVELEISAHSAFFTRIFDASEKGTRIVTWHHKKKGHEDTEKSRMAFLRDNAHVIIKDLASALRSVYALTQERPQGVEPLGDRSTLALERTDTILRILTVLPRFIYEDTVRPEEDCDYVVDIHFECNAHTKEAFENKVKTLAGCANFLHLLHFSEDELRDAVGLTLSRIPKSHVCSELEKYRGVLGSLHIRLVFPATRVAINAMLPKINDILAGGPLAFGPKDLADVTSVQWVTTHPPESQFGEWALLFEGFFQKLTGPDTKPLGCIQLEDPPGQVPDHDGLCCFCHNETGYFRKLFELQFVHLQERDSVELANQFL